MKRREDEPNAVIRKLIPGLVGLALLVSCLIGTQAETLGENASPSDLRLTVMSQELLEGVSVGADARFLYVQADL